MASVLRITRKTQYEWAAVFVITMPFAFGALIDWFGFPSLVKYTIDIVWLFLLFAMGINRFRMPNSATKILFSATLIFLIITVIGFLFALQNPFYYLWGFRNNFRFFVFFFSCTMFINHQNTEGYLELFDKLFYLNFLIILFQFFVLGYSGDYLGGIFGVHVGCNDTTIVFLSIIVAKSVLYLSNNQESVKICVVKILMSLVVAVLAEIKLFFVLLLVILFMSALATSFSIRKVFIIVFSVLAVVTGANILVLLFPNWENWFSIEYMFSSALSSNGYTDSGDMNRLTSIPIAWEMFLTTWPKRLFGLGLGNCDTSAFSFLNTAFFERFGYLHYNWFSASFMFMETGILGLSCYVVFFVLVYLFAGKRSNSGAGKLLYCQLAKIVSVVSVILIIYNQSMRTEAAYMVYFVLALPFLADSSGRQGSTLRRNST